MLKTLLPFLLILACYHFSFAQKDPVKWGKVPDADLQMTVYAKFPDASALVLCDYGNIEFASVGDDWGYRFSRIKRVKIFKRSGFAEADIFIDYNKKYERLSGVKAQVFAPNGEVYEIAKDDLFETNLFKEYYRMSFAAPNIQEGSVIEYKYEITSNSLFSFDDWYFQGKIPTRWSEFRLEMPKMIEFVKQLSGFENLTLANCEESSRSYNGHMHIVNYCRWVGEDLPGLTEEPYITTLEDYAQRIGFQMQAINVPGQPVREIKSTWEKVSADLMVSPHFGMQCTRKGNFNKLYDATAPLVASASAEEKIKILSDYLSKNIEEQTLFRSIYVQKSLDDAFEKKSALSSERNMMLVALLKEHGLDAHPALISTRDHGRPVVNYPLMDQFNHVLAYAKIGEKEWLLDVGDADSPAELLQTKSLNKAAFVVDKDKPRWVEIKPAFSGGRYFFNLELDGEGGIKGNFVYEAEGYKALYERWNFKKDEKGSFWQERFEGRFPGTTVEKVKLENLDDKYLPVKSELNLRLPEAAQMNGDYIYLPAILFSNFSENPFKLQSRKFPVEMPYPLKEQIVYNIKIPTGYAVEELPQPASLILPAKGAKFQYLISEKDGMVQVVMKINVDQLYYQPEEYGALKNFFDIIAQKSGEQVVFKKL